ncbi:hypothetical protein CI610_02860 [invertebrate metagenome]|uniref:Uncharacterized protein n=1 Tax=invertebrate metagenome TaxID=1711999 RepID=A0A2H9T4R4_9ZZZZ
MFVGIYLCLSEQPADNATVHRYHIQSPKGLLVGTWYINKTPTD